MKTLNNWRQIVMVKYFGFQKSPKTHVDALMHITRRVVVAGIMEAGSNRAEQKQQILGRTSKRT